METTLSRNNLSNWLSSVVMFQLALKNSMDLLKDYPTNYLNNFTDRLLGDSKNNEIFFQYQIKHKSGWTYTTHVLKVGTERWEPIYFKAKTGTGKEVELWYCKQQLAVFSEFNRVFL